MYTCESHYVCKGCVGAGRVQCGVLYTKGNLSLVFIYQGKNHIYFLVNLNNIDVVLENLFCDRYSCSLKNNLILQMTFG